MLQLPVCELGEVVLHNSDTITAERASVLPLLTQGWVIQHLLATNSSKAFSQLLKKICKADFPTHLVSSHFLFNQDHGVSRRWTELDLSEHFAPRHGLYLTFCSLMQLEMISPSFTATMWDGEKKMHIFFSTDGEDMWLWLEPWFTVECGNVSQASLITCHHLRCFAETEHCLKQRDFEHSVNTFLSFFQ